MEAPIDPAHRRLTVEHHLALQSNVCSANKENESSDMSLSIGLDCVKVMSKRVWQTRPVQINLREGPAVC